MAEYAIVFARSARKELQALDPAVAARILKRIEALATNPRPDGVKKLEGATDLWRIRVGDWLHEPTPASGRLLARVIGTR